LRIIGPVLVIVGGIWVLQGIGVLPGSFMDGQIQWTSYGGILGRGAITSPSSASAAPAAG